MSSAACWTFPEFILNHTKYEVWLAGSFKPDREYACSLFNKYAERLSEVAVSAKTKNNINKLQWDKIQFVNINLSKAEKTQFKSWYSDIQPELGKLLATFISAGYKTSIKWDNGNDCFIATVTCEDQSLENYGKALSSRSDDFMEALALNYFKTDVISDKGVWSDVGGGNSWG